MIDHAEAEQLRNGPTRVDWFRVIVQLQRLGWTYERIGSATDSGTSTVREWLSMTVEPAHWRGELLLDLWAAQTGKRRDSAPTTRRYSRRVT